MLMSPMRSTKIHYQNCGSRIPYLSYINSGGKGREILFYDATWVRGRWRCEEIGGTASIFPPHAIPKVPST